ncbi:MAG: hypothetical protein HYY24_28280 [Verrucomicrobia bacterium]|nr:hypothetical protein [Verrucomicrobiota bacterium]
MCSRHGASGAATTVGQCVSPVRPKQRTEEGEKRGRRPSRTFAQSGYALHSPCRACRGQPEGWTSNADCCQDACACHGKTRDTASHFFIDYLPKGAYVFEYSSRIQHRGEYQSGFAEIQCMYAPEFNSHSESLSLVVR